MFRPARSVQAAFSQLIALFLLAGCGASSGPSVPLGSLPGCATGVPPLGIDLTAAEAAIGYPDVAGDDNLAPVLLIHGTGSTSFESWASTYKPALVSLGYTVYTIDLPGKSYVDIQESSAFLVYALRRVYGLTGKRINIVAHSQGGLEPRWVMRWWPDTRAMIGDLITLGTPHFGTAIIDAYCAPGCKPAHWQMGQSSEFLAALNETPTVYPGVAVTSIFSSNDELVQPQEPESTSALPGASNIRIQEFCPGRPVDHVGLMRDGAVWAVVLDALEHDGPADFARLDPLDCANAFVPGASASDGLQANYYFWASGDSDVPDTDHEPPLADYVCR